MKLLSLILTSGLAIAITTNSLQSMECAASKPLLIPKEFKEQLPLLKNSQETQYCRDDYYGCKVANKTLLLLMLEAHEACQSQKEDSLLLEFWANKIYPNRVRVPQSENGTTQLTPKDLNHRLLSSIRAIGKPIQKPNLSFQGPVNRTCTPIVIGNKIAYLHQASILADRDHITLLEDFSDAQEISSMQYAACLTKVNEIVKEYRTKYEIIL